MGGAAVKHARRPAALIPLKLLHDRAQPVPSGTPPCQGSSTIAPAPLSSSFIRAGRREGAAA